MTLTYQFEAADWMAFVGHYLKNSRSCRRQRLGARLGVVLGILAFGGALSLAMPKDYGFAIALAVIGVVVFFAYPAVYDNSIMKRMRKALDDPDNANVLGRRTAAFLPESIRISGPGTEATIAWDNIVKLAETPDHVFLYVSADSAIVIPRRSLEGASFEEVRARLREYVGKAASTG